MKILAPVSTFDSAKILIEAGAEEIYLGADDELFRSFSFTGRGKRSYTKEVILSSFQQLQEIVAYAHLRNVQVNFLCNYQFFCDGVFHEKEMKLYLAEYIEKAIDAGVDAIVVGDIGVLEFVAKQKYPVFLHASVYLKTINEMQLLYLKEMGVKRTILSYHILMDEIKKFSQKNIMELEVIGYLGCSFYNGACSFLHDYGEGILNNFQPGVSCKSKYKVWDDNETRTEKIFDAESGCALCVLGELDKAGVTTLKIVGRERSIKQTEQVIKLYSKFLEGYRQGKSYSEMVNEIPLWWKRIWCSHLRCKYRENNENYQYIIGK